MQGSLHLSEKAVFSSIVVLLLRRVPAATTCSTEVSSKPKYKSSVVLSHFKVKRGQCLEGRVLGLYLAVLGSFPVEGISRFLIDKKRGTAF